MSEQRVGAVSDLPPGAVVGMGKDAVGNNGEYFAVTRRCRHLRADLAAGPSTRMAVWSARGTSPPTT
jgi:nitrite reductase/ring-hydroxylating ferredoxin subunit